MVGYASPRRRLCVVLGSGCYSKRHISGPKAGAPRCGAWPHRLEDAPV